MSKRLLVIANPNAGTVFTTKDHLVDALRRHSLEFDICLVDTHEAAYREVMKASNKTYEAVVAFGGDGTVISVIKAAQNINLPVLPLPGGSANIIVKNTGIPLDINKSIEAFAKNSYVTRRMPVACMNDDPLVLEFHFGVFFETVRSTPSRLKRWFGETAYQINAIFRLPNAQKHMFRLSIDDQMVEKEAYACFIVNTGNIDLLGISVLPRSKPGFVRVLMVYRRNPFVLLQWYFLRRFTGRTLRKALSVWYAKEVTVHEAPKFMNYDDQKRKAVFPMTITSDMAYTSIIVPIAKAKPIPAVLSALKNLYQRNTDQIRRHVTGIPSERFSRIDKQFFLGGQYGPKGASALAGRGVTGIISMRTFVPAPIKDHPDIEILHLPTIDETAPSIDNLKQGITFAERHISTGGSVYVHCRLGEGRGPTMAAAYLISKGMKVDDALAHLRHYRPFARPNAQQVKALRRLSDAIQR